MMKRGRKSELAEVALRPVSCLVSSAKSQRSLRLCARVMLITLFMLHASLFTASGQGIPFIRNFPAEEYHANNMNFDIDTDEEGNIYVANFEGLLYYDHAEWRIIRTPGTTRVTVVYRAEDNQIWVGGYNYFGKIQRKSNGEITLQRIGNADLFRGEVKEILESDGKLLFIVNNGYIYEVKDNQVTVNKKVDQHSLRMGMLDVVDINALEKGEKEVALNDTVLEEPLGHDLKAIVRKNSGLVIADGKHHTSYTITDANGLCSNDVAYAAYDGRGQFWGVTSKGIFSIQIPSSYTRFTTNEGVIGSVLSIEEFNGRIYAGTDDGLFRQEGMRFVRVSGINHACWDLKKSGQELLVATADGIYRLYPDGRTAHLTPTTSLTLLDEGTFMYSGELNGIYQVPANGQNPRKVCNLENVRKLLKDAEGTIWAQSLYGTVWCKKAGSENFSLYKTGEKSETMLTIVQTNGQVQVVSAEATKPFHYPLYSFMDKTGVTWLTNNEGKALYRWKDGKQLHDFDQLLFPIQETSVRAILTRQDEIWLGHDNGLIIINTKTTDPTMEITPKLSIRSVVLGGDSILWGGFGEMPEMLAELSHHENDLHFTYSLDYTPIAGKTLYRYRLNNNSWSAWSESTSAHFVNLTTGDYTFSVQAKDALNRTTDITSIRFHINPPFYLRWYMNLLYLLLLLALVYMLFRLRLRKLEKDKIRLENVIQERTAEVVKQKDEIEEKSKSLEKALDDLNTAQHELIRQEKMATVGKLTQGLIDRILNPLNYINNFSKLSEGLVKDVKANVEDDQDKMDKDNYEDTMDVLDMLSGNLQKVSEHGQNTTRTLKAMEEMLKDRSGGIVEMDLARVLRQNEEMIRTYYANDIDAHQIKVTFDMPEGELPINGNAEQLSKTIMSMLGNSIYALIKKAQREQYQPEVKVTAKAIGDHVQLTVRDNGIGIEEAIVNKIFDPFFTTKPTGEASGVGLYLSREIIQNHGGDISVKSVKNDYSEFTITLPILRSEK